MIATDSAFPRPVPSLYRQYFTRAECRMLDSTPLDSALSEISLLRILLLRLLAAARRKRPLSLAQHLSVLGGFSAAGLIMASLVRYHCRRFPPGNPLLEALAEMDPDDI
jgi:hypothetical protein